MSRCRRLGIFGRDRRADLRERSGARFPMNESMLVASVLLGVFVIGVMSIVGGFIHARRERQLVHAERLKALEWGIVLADGGTDARKGAAPTPSSTTEVGSREALARKSYSTALWVAFWGFAAAAGLGGADVSAGVAYAIAASTGAIGVTAVICGTILAARMPAASHADAYMKQTADADAYDVVSCRG
jgi:hypothetical protein